MVPRPSRALPSPSEALTPLWPPTSFSSRPYLTPPWVPRSGSPMPEQAVGTSKGEKKEVILFSSCSGPSSLSFPFSLTKFLFAKIAQQLLQMMCHLHIQLPPAWSPSISTVSQCEIGHQPHHPMPPHRYQHDKTANRRAVLNSTEKNGL